MAPGDRELVELLLHAYRHGAFPMGNGRDGPLGLEGAFDASVDWLSVDPRSIIPIRDEDGAAAKFSRSLRARVRSRRFEITSDTAFVEVMKACAEPRPSDQGGAWINAWMVDAYTRLHEAGHAHSIEAWVTDKASDERRLVGGLYGVHIGAAFFGESMFSRTKLGGTDASKVCFVHLVSHLRERAFMLLDSQYSNPHMDQFGPLQVSADEYAERLVEATEVATDWEPFDPNAAVRMISGAYG